MAYIIYNKAFKDIYSHRINDFCNFELIIDEYIRKDLLENLTIILPTKRIIKYLQFQLVNKYFDNHKKPLSDYNIYNFEDFTNLLYKQVFQISQSQEISDALRLIIFEEAYSKANLEFFNQKNNRAKYEIIRRLNELVYGIREDGFDKIQAENDLQLIAAGEYPENLEGKKYSDILRILIEYENILSDKLFDKPAKLQKLLQFLESLSEKEILEFYDKLFNNQLIMAYGFSEFKMPEVELLSLFAKVDIPFALVLDFSPDNGPLFGNFFEYIEKFENNGFEVYSDDRIFEESEQYLSMEGYDNYFFRKHLFHFEKNDLIHLQKPIKIIEGQNQKDEVSKIAKLIKYLNIKKGIALKDIAVVSRNPGDYSDYFREIFRIEQIPANITDRYRLWKSPIVNKIYAFIEFALNGYKISTLKRLFNNTSINFDFKVDIDNLVYLANELRIQPRFCPVTPEYWIKTLESSKSFYQNSLSTLSDKIDLYRFEKLIAKIERGIIDVKTINSNLHIVNEKMSGREFRTFIIRDIILKFNFNENLRQKVKKILEINTGSHNNISEDIEKEAKGLMKFIDVVNDIAYLYETRSNEKFTLKEWYERLKIGVYNERYQISGKMNNSVDITSIEQIRYIPYKVKILCGASEGVFPSAYAPEKLFGKELPDAKQKHIRAERVLFYQLLTSSNFLFNNNQDNEIYIFYPRTIQGYQTPSSPFIDSLKSIVEFDDEDISDLEKSNAQFSMITNESEFFDYIGKRDYTIENGDIPVSDNQLQNLINHYIQKNNLTDELNYHKDIKPINLDNLLSVNIHKNLIDAEFREKSYSISELETYAKCPYLYFTKYLLNIKEARKKELTLGPIEIGSFLHKILYEFYQELINNNISTEISKINNIQGETLEFKYVKLTPEYISIYKEILQQIAQKNLDMPVKDYQILNYQIRQLTDFAFARNLLYRWLKNEVYQKILPFFPAFFEQHFETELVSATNSSNSSDSSQTKQSIKVNGKIDKIEVNFVDDILEFGVGDYKLSPSSIPSETDIYNLFVSFQMPIYMLGFQKYINETAGIKAIPVFGVYNLLNPTSKKNNAFTYVLVNYDLSSTASINKKSHKSEIGQTELLKNSLDAAISIKHYITNGNFKVEPYNEDKICPYCNYYSMCKIRLL